MDNRQSKPELSPSAGVDLRAAITNDMKWSGENHPYGIYQVPMSEDAKSEFVFLTNERNMGGGAVYVDGVIYAISKTGTWTYEEDEYEEEMVWTFNDTGAAFSVFDAETGEMLSDRTDGVSRDLFASDLTYDKTTGNIYGCFKGTGYQTSWGILDIDKLEIKYIKEKMSSNMSAIAADANGVIYGVTSGGDLVTINKETGDLSEPLASYKMYNGYQSTGVIDPATNTFYWMFHSYSTPGIYKIDLNSYELTKLCVTKNDEQWAGAYIATAATEEGAPGTPDNLVLSFPEGALTGTLTFNAPAVNENDDDLSGTTLNYTVKNDEETVAQSTVVAGETATTKNFTVTTGYHNISVMLSNDKGESNPANIQMWFGNDSPNSVTGISLSADNNKIDLSWTAPETGSHNGYINSAEVTYTVTRTPDNVVVAKDIKATKYTDLIESKTTTKYYYTIVPSFAGQEGKSATSQGVIVGEGVNLPWECTFDEEDCELLTIEDTNNDGTTWDACDGDASYRFGDVDGDDWLFTAPFHFEAGYNYRIITSIISGLGRAEKFEIKVGKSPASTAMTTTIVDPTDFEDKYFDVDKLFSVGETGKYYIGIHAMSPESHFVLSLEKILVEVGANNDAPAAPEVTAKAGEKGDLSAILTITAPTKAINDVTLTNLEGAQIFRNGKLIDSMEDVEPGKTYTYTDYNSEAGNNIYTVVFVNEAGNGLLSETSVFVGNDSPVAPQNAHVSFKDGVATLTWDGSGDVGTNGGYVDPATLKYAISYIDQGEWIPFEETSDNTMDIDYNTSGKQRWFLCGIAAFNQLGASDPAYSNALIVGDPYSMPYKESLDDGVNKSMFASTNPFGSTAGGYGSDVVMSASEKGGCLKFSPYAFLSEAPYCDTLTTGIINTAGYNDVTLSFYYYNDAENNVDDELTVSLYDQENDLTYNLGSIKMDNTATEWRKFEIKKNIVSDSPLRIHIGIKSVNGKTIYLDEFSLDGTLGVSNINSTGIAVRATRNAINCYGLDGGRLTMTSVNGTVVYSAEVAGDVTVPVEAGIYIVNAGGRAYKVIVK